MNKTFYFFICLFALSLVGCNKIDDTMSNSAQASTISEEQDKEEKAVEVTDVINVKNTDDESPEIIKDIEMNIPESFIVEEKNKRFISLVGTQENQGLGFGVGISYEKVMVSPEIIEDILNENGAEIIESIDANKYPGLKGAYYSIKAKTNNQVEYALYKRNGDKIITIGGKIDNAIYSEELEARFLDIMSSVMFQNRNLAY